MEIRIIIIIIQIEAELVQLIVEVLEEGDVKIQILLLNKIHFKYEG